MRRWCLSGRDEQDTILMKVKWKGVGDGDGKEGGAEKDSGARSPWLLLQSSAFKINDSRLRVRIRPVEDPSRCFCETKVEYKSRGVDIYSDGFPKHHLKFSTDLPWWFHRQSRHDTPSTRIHICQLQFVWLDLLLILGSKNAASGRVRESSLATQNHKKLHNLLELRGVFVTANVYS